MSTESLANLIAEARRNQGLTQTELAEQIGRSKTWIVDVERGRTIPDETETLTNIAIALHLELSQLVIRSLLERAKMLRSLDSSTLDSVGELFLGGIDTPEITHAKPVSSHILEKSAEALATKLFPRAVADGVAIPVVRALNMIVEGEFEFGTPLPVTLELHRDNEEGRTCVVGDKIVIGIRADVWERAKEGDGRSRFTCSHELAHATLHADLLQQSGHAAFRDRVCTASQKLAPGQRIYTSPEWQANTWASAFLMPTRAVARFIQREGEAEDGCSIEALASNFRVSQIVAQIRLGKVLPKITHDSFAKEVRFEDADEG